MHLAEFHTEYLFILIFPAFFIVFIGMWCLVCATLSAIGGWKKLANQFPQTSPPTGKKFYMQSGSIGLANYNNCLTLQVNHTGINLSVLPIFRFAHKPIFLPWNELNNPEVKKFLWHKYVRIDVGSPKIATITLSEKAFSSFKDMM